MILLWTESLTRYSPEYHVCTIFFWLSLHIYCQVIWGNQEYACLSKLLDKNIVKSQTITKLWRLEKFKRQKKLHPKTQKQNKKPPTQAKSTHPHRHRHTNPPLWSTSRKEKSRWMTVRREMTEQEDEDSFHVNQKLACF